MLASHMSASGVNDLISFQSSVFFVWHIGCQLFAAFAKLTSLIKMIDSGVILLLLDTQADPTCQEQQVFVEPGLSCLAKLSAGKGTDCL